MEVEAAGLAGTEWRGCRGQDMVEADACARLLELLDAVPRDHLSAVENVLQVIGALVRLEFFQRSAAAHWIVHKSEILL